MYQDYSHLKFEQQGRILTVTLNRPEVKNAVNARLHHELARVFGEIAEDKETDVVVLTGEGNAFCAGGDIGMMRDMQSSDRPENHLSINEGRTIIYSMLDLDKPVIARVKGPAIGLGATLALYCDLIIAGESAVFGDPHVKVGLVAGDGGALIWPLLVGFNRAKEYLMTGDILSAHEAERIGLVNYVVPDAELDEKVRAMAEKLARGATLAIRGTKKAINLSLRQLSATLEMGFSLEEMTFKTKDHQEAVSSFLEKRKPNFRGQ